MPKIRGREALYQMKRNYLTRRGFLKPPTTTHEFTQGIKEWHRIITELEKYEGQGQWYQTAILEKERYIRRFFEHLARS